MGFVRGFGGRSWCSVPVGRSRGGRWVQRGPRGVRWVLTLAAASFAFLHLESRAASPSAWEGGVADESIGTLLVGLEAYEASIYSIAWTQRVYAPPNSDFNSPGVWTLNDETRRYWDVGWCWSVEGRLMGRMPPDFEVSYDRVVMACDGVRRLSWSADDRQGVLAGPDAFVVGGLQLLRALGRSYDMDGAPATAPLSSLLRGAASLTLMPPTPEEPWPGVRAIRPLRQWDVNIEARLDPSRGMMPCVLRLERPADGLVADELHVISSRVVDGLHVPWVCVQGPRSIGRVTDPDAPLHAHRARDVADALGLRGLPAEVQSDRLRAVVAELLRVTPRGGGLAVAPLGLLEAEGDGLVTPQVLVVSDVRLNVATSLRATFDEVLEAASDFALGQGRVFDGFTGEFLSIQQAVPLIEESRINALLRDVADEEASR
jgi:hypothetical protein